MLQRFLSIALLTFSFGTLVSPCPMNTSNASLKLSPNEKRDEFPSAPVNVSLEVVPLGTVTANLILTWLPPSEMEHLIGYHLSITSELCELTNEPPPPIFLNISKNATTAEGGLLIFQCPYVIVFKSLPENPSDVNKSSFVYRMEKLVVDYNDPEPLINYSITFDPHPLTGMYVLMVEWEVKNVFLSYIMDVRIIVGYEVVSYTTGGTSHVTTLFETTLKNTSHAKNKTTKILPPLQPGDHDIFQGPLKYYIKIYQKNDKLEWYRHFPAVTKVLEAPTLVPGIVGGVTVPHSEYDSEYHTVNYSLKWDPPSAPYGNIINYNIQIEERKHISDDVVQTSILHTEDTSENSSYLMTDKRNSLHAQIWAVNENGSGRKAHIEIYNFTEVENHYIEASTSQTDPTLTISLSIVTVVVLVLLGASGLVLATIVIKKRMRKNSWSNESTFVSFSIYIGEKETEPSSVIVDYSQLLGSGNYGNVYLGLFNSQKVAVKMLRELEDKRVKQHFYDEVHVMQLVSIGKHPNVVNLLACCTLHSPKMAILELAMNGSLLEFLRRKDMYNYNISNIPYNNLVTEADEAFEMEFFTVDCCRQIAQGMRYIAGVPLIHCDLACRNVLITEGGLLKISDFGNALCPSPLSAKQFLEDIPVRWMPPEYIFHKEISSKLDIWSFGVVMWEIFTLGEVPYVDIVDNDDVSQYVREGNRLERPSECPESMYEIMKSTWSVNPSDRPGFQVILSQIIDFQHRQAI